MKFLKLGFLLMLAGALLSGCSGDAFSLSKQDLAAFQNAAPEIKQAWEQGLKADKANDYIGASTNYRSILIKEITPEQLVAVQTALGGLNLRLNEAIAKGDAAAQKAANALKETGGLRR
ncbi:MAG: hypothetical protein QM813_03100 [Verrucomicrobiota bacterium]